MTNYIILELVGRDSWMRPVYKHNERLYVDTDPRADREPALYTKYRNAFDGEPDSPIEQNVQFTFFPYRDVWK